MSGLLRCRLQSTRPQARGIRESCLASRCPFDNEGTDSSRGSIVSRQAGSPDLRDGALTRTLNCMRGRITTQQKRMRTRRFTTLTAYANTARASEARGLCRKLGALLSIRGAIPVESPSRRDSSWLRSRVVAPVPSRRAGLGARPADLRACSGSRPHGRRQSDGVQPTSTEVSKRSSIGSRRADCVRHRCQAEADVQQQRGGLPEEGSVGRRIDSDIGVCRSQRRPPTLAKKLRPGWMPVWRRASARAASDHPLLTWKETRRRAGDAAEEVFSGLAGADEHHEQLLLRC